MADLGQVFTKSNVAHYMVSLFDLPKQAAIMDPCFGAGSFLDALLDFNYNNVTACELDTFLYEENKTRYCRYKLYNGDFLKYRSSSEFDGIIMNPPYIRQEKIDELNEYGITKEALRTDSVFNGLPRMANLYMYFIIKAIDLLKNDGQLVVIFPSSWMNARIGVEFQKVLLSKCGIEKKIHIYGEIFEREPLVEVIILKLIKGRLCIGTNEEYLESTDGQLKRVLLKEYKTFEDFVYPFSELATIKRGLTTGCNEMYINPKVSYKDNRYIKPIISSPKSINGYTTFNARLDNLFYPIEDTIPTEILTYIEHWKNRIIQEKKPKSLYSKINNSEKWYELRANCGEGILFSYFVRNDMKFVMNETGVLARDNFYVIKPKIDQWVLFALLNNYYTYYQLEMNGKKYGAGLLKLQRYDVEGLFFPDYQAIQESDKVKMAKLSHRLIENSDASVIGEITKVISKYSSLKFEDISERYVAVKSARLEVK